MYRHCPSANRVSNASDDLPDPETPVTTVSRSWGISTEMFLRLFCRAPSMRRAGGCDIRAVLLRWVVYWRCYHGVQMPDTIHVLVVDDDTNVRGLLVAVLSRSPFAVVDAGSGGEAMAHLAREEFDVALVDVQLPDHSGLDILRWARDADVDAELIVLTGHADVETAVEAMRLGAYDFITKPWKNPELLEVVAKAPSSAPSPRSSVSSRRPTAAPASWTRSARCRRPCRCACSAPSTPARCGGWARSARFTSTCASWRPRPRTSRVRRPRAASAGTSSTA